MFYDAAVTDLVIGTRPFETKLWSDIQVSIILIILRSKKMCLEVNPITSIINYPVTRRHIQAVQILHAVDRMQDGTGGLVARMTQKELKRF